MVKTINRINRWIYRIGFLAAFVVPFKHIYAMHMLPDLWLAIWFIASIGMWIAMVRLEGKYL